MTTGTTITMVAFHYFHLQFLLLFFLGGLIGLSSLMWGWLNTRSSSCLLVNIVIVTPHVPLLFMHVLLFCTKRLFHTHHCIMTPFLLVRFVVDLDFFTIFFSTSTDCSSTLSKVRLLVEPDVRTLDFFLSSTVSMDFFRTGMEGGEDNDSLPLFVAVSGLARSSRPELRLVLLDLFVAESAIVFVPVE